MNYPAASGGVLNPSYAIKNFEELFTTLRYPSFFKGIYEIFQKCSRSAYG